MKRLVILGLAVLLVLGMGVFALGDDVELIIEEGCIPGGIQFNSWPDGADAGGSIGEYLLLGTVTGNANADHAICVCIDGPLKDGDGHILQTSLHACGKVIGPQVDADDCIQCDTTWDGTGVWTVEIGVDVMRNGYADHAGTYTATVTVTCGAC